MKVHYFVLMASLSLSLYAVDPTKIPSINDLMSIPDQKKTGVINLKQDQKKELAEWLVSHHIDTAPVVDTSVQTPSTVPDFYVGKVVIISMNIQSGKQLAMEDGSIWEIRPEDRVITSSWISPIKLLVSLSNDNKYPYALKDLRTSDVVFANKLPQVMESGPSYTTPSHSSNSL